MDTKELLYSRKSVRSYTGEKVSEELLQTILMAGQASPVGMGQYGNLHFTVIESPALLQKIDAAAGAMFGDPSRHPLYGAPTLILISVKAAGGEIGNVSYSNAAIAAHNMSLAAVDAGAGQCLIWGAVRALNDSPALVAELGLPDGFVPACGVTIGQTQQEYALRDIPADRIGVTRLQA